MVPTTPNTFRNDFDKRTSGNDPIDKFIQDAQLNSKAIITGTIGLTANLVRDQARANDMRNSTMVCSDKTGTLTQNNMSVITGTIGLTANLVRDQARANDFTISPHFENPIPLQQLEEILSSDIIGLLEESIVINSIAFEKCV
ncbi:hypothetical protein Glove_203g44 [Diversispora epigaea]|uniref:Cation-transporting P-type ATPase C-terminal domain-containing protein n=1 Tax=Diversispora epigaea TaxID=1348612 RepID=A0A397IMB8_9GLOM|nr:hypothetical protein Glove_203g44 [Diversispora epigaea]